MSKLPHSNKRLYSVSVIALLEYMYTEIDCGPSSFHCLLKASRQKVVFVSVSQLSPVHSSERSRLKILRRQLVPIVIARKDLGTTSLFFCLFDPQPTNHSSLVSHSAVPQKRNKRPVSNRGPPLRF